MPLLAKLLRSKLAIWIMLVLPGLWPIWPIFIRPNASVRADALKYVLLHLGFTASVLLAVVLMFTPLRVLFPKWDVALALNRHRRLVGVAAFVYGALHFATHLYYENDVTGIVETLAVDVTKPFLLIGLISFTILLVLAITSLHAAVRWLGGKLWKNVHRFAYLAAALIAYHQSAARKIFPMQVVWIYAPLVALEIARIVKQRAKTPKLAGLKPVAAAANRE